MIISCECYVFYSRGVPSYSITILRYCIILFTTKTKDAKYIIKQRNNKEHVLVPEPFRITHLTTTKFVEMILSLLHVANYAYLFRTCPASPAL